MIDFTAPTLVFQNQSKKNDLARAKSEASLRFLYSHNKSN